MPDLHFTNHTEARMRQRGFRKADIDMNLRVAMRIADDAFFLTDKDAAREIETRRREIQPLERLRAANSSSKALLSLRSITQTRRVLGPATETGDNHEI